MPLPVPDFNQVFAPGARHEGPGGDVATVRLRRETSLWLPSGRVVACEPFGFDPGDTGFTQQVPPGEYPVELVIADFHGAQHDYDVVAAIKLVIRDEPPATWEMAVSDDQDVSELGDDEFFGYPVDGGTGGFMDPASLDTFGEDYIDRIMMSLETRDEDYTAPCTVTDEDGRVVVVSCSSGGGDGYYPTWVGRTADGEIACFLTDFFILTDDEDEDEEEPAAAAQV